MIKMINTVGLHPVIQGLCATLFTYGVTALGAACVFFIKNIRQGLIDLMLGFSAGVMTAASFWSLLAPAIDISEQNGSIPWLSVSVGFICGGVFVILSDVFLTAAGKYDKSRGKTKRSIMLASAVTLHNIPEGLAVGVAFGSSGGSAQLFTGACMLALGIGFQNFPEGMCVSMPLYLSGQSKRKSFFIGQLSGVVEPIAGVIGALFAMAVRSLLPFALSFSGGAMISVVCSELVPEAFSGNKRAAQAGVIAGFALMMILDIALG